MNNILFSNSFNFNTFEFTVRHYTDNRSGCKYNYLAYLREGTAKFILNGETVEINAGDCLFIPFNCLYHSFWSGKPNIVFDSYGFTYYPNPENVKYSLQKVNLPSDLRKALENVKTEQNHTCENIGKFYAVFGEILKYMEPSYENKSERIVAEAEKFMSSHQNCKINDVAKYCNVSESALYYMFKEIKGKTPASIRQKLQIEKSIQLLCSSEMKIEDIAEKSGFSSAIYFRQVFKKVPGKTPREIRKINAP